MPIETLLEILKSADASDDMFGGDEVCHTLWVHSELVSKEAYIKDLQTCIERLDDNHLRLKNKLAEEIKCCKDE